MKLFSQACENNKGPILEQLKRFFADVEYVLEIGSGTGQHSVYFGEHLSHLTWQTSDLLANHVSIEEWLKDAGLSNVLAPVELDVHTRPWPFTAIEAVFTANTLHIMSWQDVVAFFEASAMYLKPSGLFCIYGPFNFNGGFTSESNQHFDASLKQRDANSGIRDFEKINALAEEADLVLLDDIPMPANNHLIVFKKIA